MIDITELTRRLRAQDPSLDTVEIANRDMLLHPQSPAFIAALTASRNVRKLKISGNFLHLLSAWSFHRDIFKLIGNLPYITNLDLSGVAFDILNDRLTTGNEMCLRITHNLNDPEHVIPHPVKFFRFDFESLDIISCINRFQLLCFGIATARNLRILSLVGNNLGLLKMKNRTFSEGQLRANFENRHGLLVLIEHMSRLKHLQLLDLSSNSLALAPEAVLLELSKFIQRLTHLSLRDNDIGRMETKKLKALFTGIQSSTSLKYLDLSENNLSLLAKDHLTILVDAFKNHPSLTRIIDDNATFQNILSQSWLNLYSLMEGNITPNNPNEQLSDPLEIIKQFLYGESHKERSILWHHLKAIKLKVVQKIEAEAKKQEQSIDINPSRNNTPSPLLSYYQFVAKSEKINVPLSLPPTPTNHFKPY